MKDQPKKYASRGGRCMIRFSLVVRRVEGLLESLLRSVYLPSIQILERELSTMKTSFPLNSMPRVGNLQCGLSSASAATNKSSRNRHERHQTIFA